MSHTRRKARLEALLLGFQRLWRPQPFRIETPDWCHELPGLTAELLALDDAAVAQLEGDNAALIALLSRHVPALGEMAGLIALPTLSPPSGPPSPVKGEGMRSPSPPRGEEPGRGWESPRLFTDIPGRKRAQIEACAAALDEPRAPLLEWCAGKGHLGRVLARRWQRPVASLEIDTRLCAAGEDLARRAGVDRMQRFIAADALAADSDRHLAGRHAIALHACGDLHTRLIAAAVARASPAIDLAPCCYYRTAREPYQAFSPTPLALSRDDLRLAVTETVTASASQRQRSRRALAWKLAWVELRRRPAGETGYRPFPPTPEAWLKGDFAGFIQRMLARSGDGHASDGADLASLEATGHARAARMLRLQLVRLAFRRPLEVWLLTDMAVHLERHGYAVTVGAFCPPSLTPRNLLLSARR